MIDPRGMRDMKEWVDFITLPLEQLGVTPRGLDDSEDWKAWAFNLTQSGAVAKFYPPDPRGFTDWVEWAERFNQVVPL